MAVEGFTHTQHGTEERGSEPVADRWGGGGSRPAVP